MANVSPEGILKRFQPQVSGWFSNVFAAPTPVQAGAWEAISAGENALVVAPTGSGKTLAAFLWSLNLLLSDVGQTTLPVGRKTNNSGTDSSLSTLDSQSSSGVASTGGVKILYISPLKALGVDVQRNLRAPLLGINREAANLGLPENEISVGVRSGDTPAAERRKQLRTPPDILITTPESAYLMLTSKAAGILTDVHTVIIDEIHALAGTKRGVHLALTLERLEMITKQKPQRIGLSATVRPLEAVASFLGGDRPVEIINPAGEKKWDLKVRVPVEDMSDLPTPEPGSTIGEATIDDPLGLSTPLVDDSAGFTAEESALPQQGSIWPFIEAEVYKEIMEHRSTLVFVNSRRSAERLTSALNELYAKEHDPASLSPETRRPPAQLMAQSDVAGAAAPLLARAHHGSVSKDERAMTETMLKEGELRAVVATSSLELGIDMGAVEKVIQVESPPSVASGLQRVGRAGHVVGAVSEGSFYPKHRMDLVDSTVIVERMQHGLIEELKVPVNALDVLLQQTVAAVAVAGSGDGENEGLDVDQWYATVTKSYPYRGLAREVFDAVIDLASGVYPSTDFAELKPRINFDRITGLMTPRPGAQRVAVTSGGTIPDRGMFGVYLVGGEAGARRVGELDEEMVYESRVGDIFTLGASSWRVEEINRDQVLVTPAPGHTGRLPFWTGDNAGRPAELGRAIGAFRREVLADVDKLHTNADLDAFARDNLLKYLVEQQEATGIVPDEKTLVLERFKDELGDWRVVLHSPFGRGVNAAWALAIGARISERTGMDAQPVSSDDGIVLRLPEGETEPGADLFFFDPDEAEEIIKEQVGNSALFASRFRECAARGLLLPRKNPGKRAPLWQQRQRAAQLLDVARKYPSFPIILETVRECLQDVYDLPELRELLAQLELRKVRIAEVTTDQPSPFASSILFNYTGAFMYEGDSPLAEKRAAALALDPALLAKLLGTVELRELLSPEIIAEVDEQLRRVSPDRKAKTAEQLADTLRMVGPVPVSSIGEHLEEPMALDGFLADLGSRVMRVRIGGVEHYAQSLDAALLRDGLGVPVPAGISAQVETILDALTQLISRWVRTRGPFVMRDLQAAFGLSAGMAHNAIRGLVDDNRLIAGHYRQGVDDEEYVAPEVLKIIRSRSLAQARAQTAPVSHSAFARFLPAWQQVAPIDKYPEQRGPDAVFAVCEQLAGVRLPASAWETLVFPQRVARYSPTDLDELLQNGEVHVVGAGNAGTNDPWVMLLPADYAAELLPILDEQPLSQLQEQILGVLSRGGGFLFSAIAKEISGEGFELGLETKAGATPKDIRDAMWHLFEMGLISPDGFTPLRSRLAGAGGAGKTAHRSKRSPTRSRLRMGRTSFAQHHNGGAARGAAVPQDMVGRWSLTIPANREPNARSIAHGEAWLDRYGVLTRGAVVSEDVIGGFALAYKVLSRFEEAGKAMRGLIIDGLGAAQFSTPAVIDRLRGLDDSPDVDGWPSGTDSPDVYVLAAADPANPYGASVPWPGSADDEEDAKLNSSKSRHRMTRAAGAMVVLADGLLLAHISRGGKSITIPEQNSGINDMVIPLVVWALSECLAKNMATRILIEKINGDPALESPLMKDFKAAGAGITPSGIRITASTADSRANLRVSGHSRVHSGRRSGDTITGPGRSLSDALEALDDSVLSFDDTDTDDSGFPPPRANGGFTPRGGRGFRR